MIDFWDYHIHSELCRHATGSLEDYVIHAIKIGLKEIGISEHIPYEYLPDSPLIPRLEYGMPEEQIKFYFEETTRLREKYSGKIILKTGMEIDYYTPNQDAIQRFINTHKDKLDYIIGSVHYIYMDPVGVWPVDDERYCQYNAVGVDNAYNTYLDQMIKLVQTGLYDILAHIDLPKKHGYRPNDKLSYMKRIESILDLVKKKNMVIEMNTAGLRKYVKEPYPELTLLKMIIERDIPMILSSDSHKPEEIAYNFRESFETLRNLGLKTLCKFSKRHKELIKI